MIHPRSREYDWYCMADPGTSGSAFAVLFAAVNPHVPFIYFVDEIYEIAPELTTVGKIGPQIIEKCRKYHSNPKQWNCRYDSAAAWFRVNFDEQFCDRHKYDCGLQFIPVEKKANEMEDGLDTINDLTQRNSYAISANCPHMIWEMDNYMRDAKGRLPRKNNHQIDNFRYLVKTAGIVSGVGVEREIVKANRKTRDMRRAFSPAEDLARKRRESFVSRVLAKYGD